MSDSGEGLVDADTRLQERMEEREQERRAASRVVSDPDRMREVESWRLARAALEQQLQSATHPVRREQIAQAMAELDRRLAGS